MVAMYQDVDMTKRRYVYMVPAPPESFGDVLRRLRLAQPWTQERVAEMVGQRLGREFDQSAISTYERGETKSPDPETLAALDDVFGKPRGFFAEFTPQGRGGVRRVRQAPPDPESVVIPPSDPRAHRVARWLQEQDDGALDNLILIIDNADDRVLEEIARTIQTEKRAKRAREKPAPVEMPAQERTEDQA